MLYLLCIGIGFLVGFYFGGERAIRYYKHCLNKLQGGDGDAPQAHEVNKEADSG